MRPCALVLLLSLACACNERDFPEITDIENLRVLAIKAEPAELPSEGGLSLMSALVVGADEAPLTRIWELCPFPGPEILSRECLVPEFQCALGVEEKTAVFLPPLEELLGSDEVKATEDLSGFKLPDNASLEVQVRLTVTAWGPPCEEGACAAGFTCTPTSDLLPTLLSCDELYLGKEPEWQASLPEGFDEEEKVCVQRREAVKGLNLVNGDTVNVNPVIDGVRLQAGEDKVPWLESEDRTFHVVPQGHSMSNPEVYYIVEAQKAQEEDFFSKSEEGTLPVAVLIPEEARESIDLDGEEGKEERVISWFSDLGRWQNERSGEVGAVLEEDEAQSAFDDPAVFLERYAPRARHVEVQVLGDTHGTVLHLGDRDCSLQRNHQKLIEEAPAADLPEAVRDRMRAAAVRLAQAIGYRSAGTVEYLYDPGRGEYYFLEMNTRLQVEHPVTEAITGIDLVEWQLRIARGEPLTLAQSDVKFDGHAIEIRIAAENPAENFRPETGEISLWAPPAGVRLDTGVEAGSVVSHHYDSMIAKLIVHAPDRAGAIRRAVVAMDAFAVGGVGLNLAYQRALLTHPDFEAFRHHTSGLPEMFPGGWTEPSADPRDMAFAAMALHLRLVPAGASPWPPWARARTLPSPSTATP